MSLVLSLLVRMPVLLLAVQTVVCNTVLLSANPGLFCPHETSQRLRCQSSRPRWEGSSDSDLKRPHLHSFSQRERACCVGFTHTLPLRLHSNAHSKEGSPTSTGGRWGCPGLHSPGQHQRPTPFLIPGSVPLSTSGGREGSCRGPQSHVTPPVFPLGASPSPTQPAPPPPPPLPALPGARHGTRWTDLGLGWLRSPPEGPFVVRSLFSRTVVGIGSEAAREALGTAPSPAEEAGVLSPA